jgi:peptidyl-prolyl cis-trans isomerase SurA
MRKFSSFHFLLVFISSCAILQKPEIEDATLFSINENPSLADEFIYVYEKNNFNNESIYTEQDVDEYFELFVNFKLKVAAAKSAGMDTTQTFLDEFATYRDQLVKPYLSETKEQERLVQEVYDRMKYEIDASHILLIVDLAATPDDTAKAYQKILEIREQAVSGDDFGELALKYSEDPSVKSNKGRLGYFSAFQMVYAFEDAAYRTEVDSVSDIVRSRFGYHILKVHDKRESSGKVKVSHIMIRSKENNTDSTFIKNKIFEIYDRIVGGADWSELCVKYSDDQRTKNNGGTLPFIGLKQINDDAFENVAFGLQNPGEISDPVKSKFGLHIIKLVEKKTLEPFEEIKKDLEKRVSKDDRSKLSQEAVISKLKIQNNFQEYSGTRDKIIQLADSTLLEGKWVATATDSISKDSLFSIDGNPYYAASAILEIEKKQKRKTGGDPKSYMNELVNDFVGESLMNYEEDYLIKTNREFRMLVNEYYEGILLFEIMNQKVWEKAVEDSLGLQDFFQNHRQSYYWGERVDAAIISTADENLLEDIKEIINSEFYKLHEITMDPQHEVEILKTPSLDSMVNLFKKYDDSTITILSNDETSTSDLYKNLLQYLKDLGLPEKSIVETIINDQKIKIHLELNSKSKKSLEFLYNKESTLTLQVIDDLFEKGDNQLIDSLGWEKGTYEVVANDNYNLILICDILKKQPKELKDIKGSVISDYQNHLEKIWLEELKRKYTIAINYSTLDRIKKLYNKKFHHPG